MSACSDDFDDEVDKTMAVFTITSDEEEIDDVEPDELDDVEPILEIGYTRPSFASRMCARVSRLFKRNKNYAEVINSTD